MALPINLPILPIKYNDLHEKGYQIIPDILTEEECNMCINKAWNWLENMNTGIDRKDKNTWKGTNWPSHSHGIIQHSRSGYTDFAWYIRSHPKVYNIFREIWQEDNLLTSFDAVCITKPTIRHTNDPSGKWHHFDQGSKKITRQCIQGFVTLEDMDYEDSTFCVYENSHNYHKDFFKQFDIDSFNDWVLLNKEQIEWINNQGCKEIRLTVKKGSLVLWDSRTTHCNTLSMYNRKNKDNLGMLYILACNQENLQQKNN